MAINRFQQPVESEYISQYVPIPFQELVTLGKYYGEQRKQAEKDLNTNIRAFGEFVSPSDVDTRLYKEESIGKLSSFINEAATNPEIMKDAAWRSRMYNALNNIDYGLLKRFEKTAENSYIREKAKAQLKANGLYEEWFDDPLYRDLSNWNTKTMGIMTNLSPDKYTTMRELGSEFTSSLKPTFYESVAPNSGQKLPFHNWLAISEQDVRRQFEDHAKDILSTDAGAKHYARVRQLLLSQNPDMSEKQIMDEFIDALTIQQSDKLIETPVLNTAALQSHLLNERNTNPRNNGSGGNKQPTLPYIFPTSVSIDQQQEISNRSEKIEYINPELSGKIKTDNKIWTNHLVNFFKELSKNTYAVEIMKKLNTELNAGGLSDELEKTQEDPAFLNAYVEGVMKNLPKDKEFDPLRKEYQKLRMELAEMSYEHNMLTSSALITNTILQGITSNGRVQLDEKYMKNPWLAVFEKPSDAILNTIDKAALSTVETHLNVPEQDIILRAIFGEDKKIQAEVLKNNALSSYDWIVKNFGKYQNNDINQAKTQTNYSREGSPVVEIEGGWFNRNVNASPDDNYSIRDKVAQGLYGSVEIVSLDGFSPVLDGKTGTSDQYTYRLTVKVPVENIDRDFENKYVTWMEGDLKGLNINERTGLHVEVENGIEYVHVPIFINRQLSSSTKGIMDALYRKEIGSSNDLDKANEERLAIANLGATSY